MDTVEIIALSMGAAWASGINLYAAIFVLGYLGGQGQIDLPPDLQILQNPLVIIAAGLMYIVEFFADKIPGVDTAWDSIHTFIRIPAGAMLAAGAVGDTNQAIELTALILGGGLAAGTHLTKSGSRVLINTSPEPVTNWTASIAEDLAVFGGLWTALNHPWIFLGLLILFIAVVIWLLPKLWRGIKRVICFIGSLFGLCDRTKPITEATPNSQTSTAAPPPPETPDKNTAAETTAEPTK